MWNIFYCDIIYAMGRVINFVGNNFGSGSKLIFDLANRLSKSKKVCLLDMDFGVNQMVYLFNGIHKSDLKDSLLNGKNYHIALNKVDKNLSVVKTSNIFFDYKKFDFEISLIVKNIAHDFDYVFLVGFMCDTKILEIRNRISSEMFLIIDNRLESLMFAKNMIRRCWNFDNIKNKKIIISNYNLIGEKEGKMLSLEKIESTLNIEVLCIKPSFIFGKKNKNRINEYIKTSVEENIKILYDYKKQIRGLFGFLRRKFYGKFYLW